uniref:Putative glycoside hydrolase, family 79 n=1 Tax=Helianthus annuus TaxID=4232 RepID=A0A251TCJ1_HELAN
MGSLIFQMGVFLFLLLLTFSCNLVDSQIVTRKDVLQGNVFIDGKSSIAKIDSDFISATMDWWPPEKCDYGTCSWGQASLLNVEMDALQSSTNHSLQAELRERTEQYNQLWIGCQRQGLQRPSTAELVSFRVKPRFLSSRLSLDEFSLAVILSNTFHACPNSGRMMLMELMRKKIMNCKRVLNKKRNYAQFHLDLVHNRIIIAG